MMNIDMKLDKAKKKLTLIIDLGHKGHLSSSGKNQLIATTGGNQDIPGFDGFKIGLSCYKPAPAPKGDE